jgi:hypothetical protein
MALAGYSDLQGHSAYQTVIQRQAERWIAYIGHDGGSAARPLTGRTESREPRQMAWMVDVSVKAHPGVASHSGGECAH